MIPKHLLNEYENRMIHDDESGGKFLVNRIHSAHFVILTYLKLLHFETALLIIKPEVYLDLLN